MTHDQLTAIVEERPEFTVDEALRIADQNAEAYDKVASVSRTLASEVRRLQAALREREGWRPIETAPRDGSEILLTNGEVVHEGHWVHDEGGTTEYRDLDGRYVGQHDSDGYIGWIDWGGGMVPEPTHWMPLPAAPTGGSEP